MPAGLSNQKKLAKASKLTFEFMPFNAVPAVVRFDLRGLTNHIRELADACGWSLEPVFTTGFPFSSSRTSLAATFAFPTARKTT
jgi:hypothetical protein